MKRIRLAGFASFFQPGRHWHELPFDIAIKTGFIAKMAIHPDKTVLQ
jgi:hypothetical protein